MGQGQADAQAMNRLVPIVALLLVVCGCAAPGKVSDTIVLSRNLRHAAILWRAEAKQRVPGKPVLLIVHGGTREGRWVFHPDKGGDMPADSTLRLLKKVYGDRDLVVVSCNEDGHKLDVPGVWYAPKGNVWSVPDRFALWRIKPDKEVGSIFEFTHNRP